MKKIFTVALMALSIGAQAQEKNNILTDTKKKIDVSSKAIEPVKVFSSFYKDIMGKEASENLKSTFIEAYEGGLNSEN